VRVLLDESVPRPWKREIPDHEVVHVADLDWQGLKNGELLRRAVAENFSALVTADRNFEYQQNLAQIGLGIVIVRTRRNRIQELRPLTPALLEALSGIRAGEVRHIGA
jgi:predicted nuclease of predicted toxin-antitoxin system